MELATFREKIYQFLTTAHTAVAQIENQITDNLKDSRVFGKFIKFIH
jgi:hypothetical protein